jgi:thioredoxin 1
MTENLTKEAFLKKVFNFEENKDWKFKGDRPAVIDFYADWYKIDTEAEQELAAAFGIRSIPAILLCPAEGEPQMANGALPKAELERIIADVLKVEKSPS